eukprot:5044701-Pleurochrysis_carterae.AAC.2
MPSMYMTDALGLLNSVSRSMWLSVAPGTATRKRSRRLLNRVNVERESSRKRSRTSSGLPSRTLTRIKGWPVTSESVSFEQPNATSQWLRPREGSKPAVLVKHQPTAAAMIR